VNTGVNDFVEDGILLSEISNNSKVDLENSVVQQQHEENNISMNSSTSTKTPPQKYYIFFSIVFIQILYALKNENF